MREIASVHVRHGSEWPIDVRARDGEVLEVLSLEDAAQAREIRDALCHALDA